MQSANYRWVSRLVPAAENVTEALQTVPYAIVQSKHKGGFSKF